jgi:hypothetical protein
MECLMKDTDKFFGALDCLENYAESLGLSALMEKICEARETLRSESRPVTVPILDMPGIVPRIQN